MYKVPEIAIQMMVKKAQVRQARCCIIFHGVSTRCCERDTPSEKYAIGQISGAEYLRASKRKREEDLEEEEAEEEEGEEEEEQEESEEEEEEEGGGEIADSHS